MTAVNNRTLKVSEIEQAQLLEKCCNFAELAEHSPELVWEKVFNQVVWGDSFEVMQSLPHHCVDLAVVDPPYNLTKQYATRSFAKRGVEEYAVFSQLWINNLKRLLKPTASLYVCCDWQTGLVLAPLLCEAFIVRNRITWQREKGRGAQANWKNAQEDIWYLTVSSSYTFNLDDVKIKRRVLAPYRSQGSPKDWQETDDGRFRLTCPSNFWDDITVPYWSMPENTQHPAQKPEKLLAKLILASSNRDDLVFDPFLGSGTTAVTAKKLSRNFLGIEREALYCALAQRRLDLADAQKSIQGYSQGVFWERNSLNFQKKLKNSEK